MKKSSLTSFIRVTTSALALIALCTLSAEAGTIHRENIDPKGNLVGRLDQAKTTVCPNDECGPTSAVNSFVFLQNKYPTLYDSRLIPHRDDNTAEKDRIAVADALAGADFMCTTCEGARRGTNTSNFFFGKRKWIDEHMRNMTRTIVKAQSAFRWNPMYPDDRAAMVPPTFENVIPRWEFLERELRDMEDVEMIINGTRDGKDFAHWLTVTSLDWTDANMDNIINDPGAMIGFIDPDGGAPRVATISQAERNGSIRIRYNRGGAIDANIFSIVSESPVPEPGTVILFGSGLAVLLGSKLLRFKRNEIKRGIKSDRRYAPFHYTQV